MTVNVSKPVVNVREKLAELDKPTGIAGEAMLRAETPQEQFNLIGAGRRNLIINGNFMISQRGDYTSSSNPSDGDFTVDRWQVIQDGSPSTTLIQNTDGSMKLTAGAATTGSMRLRQKFEYDLFPRQYDNKTFILSAKIKSNSQNARINVYAGGYLTVSGMTSHSGSGQYETLTAIFTTPATITTEFSVHIGIDGVNSANTAISNGEYFEVKEVQLELGKVATPFEHRSYGEELALCQRYYQKYAYNNNYEASGFTGIAYTTARCYFTGRYDVPMRAKPTMVANNMRVDWFSTGQNQTGYGLDNATSKLAAFFYLDVASGNLTIGDPYHAIADTSGSSYLAFDAEL